MCNHIEHFEQNYYIDINSYENEKKLQPEIKKRTTHMFNSCTLNIY